MKARALLLLALCGCSIDPFLRGELPDPYGPLPKFAADAPLEARQDYFSKHRLRIAQGGNLHLRGQSVGGEDFERFLKAEGFDEALQEYGQTGGGWHDLRQGLSGLAFLVTASYLSAAAFQNARDNILWRDMALIGIPVGLFIMPADRKPAQQRGKVAKAYNHQLMHRLKLEPGQLPRESPNELTLPKAP